MKIEPLEGIVYLKHATAKAGVLDTSSRSSAVEIAEVVAIGEGVKKVKKGDKVFVKSWAVDIVSVDGEEYRFCAVETNGILAIVK